MQNKNHRVQQIVQIEQLFDVNSLIYNKTRVWAFIRILLANQLDSDTTSQEYPIKTTTLSAQYIRYRLQSVAKFAKPLANIIYERFINQLHIQLEPLANRDFLLWSRSTDYIQQVENKYFSPYIDPFIDLIEDTYSYTNLELCLSNAPIKTPKFFDTTPLNIASFKLVRLFLEDVRSIKGLDDLCRVIYEVTGIETDCERLEEKIASHFTYVRLFSDILKIISPRAVILRSYYSPLTMALITACTQLNIITVDSQHGIMDGEPGYSNWSRLPDEGYEALPDFFWTWGQYGADTIDEWQAENYPHHQAIIGGHLWLAYKDRMPATSDIEHLVERVKQAQKVILISLQYLVWDDALPDYVLDAMQTAPANYLWLIRLHPIHSQADDVQKLINSLEQGSISNYEIDLSTQAGLSEILHLSDVHLTRSSGTVYEALAWNVPAGTFHIKGLEYFETLIQKDIVHPVLSTEAILAFIEKSEDIQIEKSHYFAETDPKIARKTLKTILTKAHASQSKRGTR